jgi:Xaa-Pro dipeptidase
VSFGSLSFWRRAVHQAYPPIVAASTRASTLHYCCNDHEFAWGPVKAHDGQNKNAFTQGCGREFEPQVLLIDAGCEWNCYASDSACSSFLFCVVNSNSTSVVTRTMPVGNGGKFTQEARAIYELVLEMQKVQY